MATLAQRPTFKSHLGSLLQCARGITSPSASRKAIGCRPWLPFRPQSSSSSKAFGKPVGSLQLSRVCPQGPPGREVQSYSPCRKVQGDQEKTWRQHLSSPTRTSWKISVELKTHAMIRDNCFFRAQIKALCSSFYSPSCNQARKWGRVFFSQENWDLVLLVLPRRALLFPRGRRKVYPYRFPVTDFHRSL